MNPPSSTASLRAWWSLLSTEPFRFFMPLGTLAALLGALVWPLSLNGWWWIPASPIEVHWRLMSEGFVGFFIVGFLGTAAPRLLGAPGLNRFESVGLMVCGVLQLVATLIGSLPLADLLFLFLLLGLIVMLGCRWPLRDDWPPPGFVLAGLSLFGTVLATSCQLLSGLAPMPAWVPEISRAWMAEMWPLLPILGVGAFFFPRLAKKASRHDFPEGVVAPAGWKARVRESFGMGTLLLVGFFLEYLAGWTRAGLGLRLIAVGWFMVREFPPTYWIRAKGGSAAMTVVGLLGICLGLALRVGWPESGVNGAHLVYLGGFALVIFGVASRVLFGHSGQAPQMHRLQPAALVFVVGTVVAAILRSLLAWSPSFVWWSYAWAGCLFAIALIVWSVRFLPGAMRPDDS